MLIEHEGHRNGNERSQRLSERQSGGETEGTAEFFGCQDSKRAVGKDKEKIKRGLILKF